MAMRLAFIAQLDIICLFQLYYLMAYAAILFVRQEFDSNMLKSYSYRCFYSCCSCSFSLGSWRLYLFIFHDNINTLKLISLVLFLWHILCVHYYVMNEIDFFLYYAAYLF